MRYLLIKCRYLISKYLIWSKFDVDFFNPKKDIETNTEESSKLLKTGVTSGKLEETLKELRYFCYAI